MGARNPMEVDTPPGNERSGGEGKIATEIEQLKKSKKRLK